MAHLLRRSILRPLVASKPFATPIATQRITRLAFHLSTAKMAPVPSTMKAVQINKNGGVEVLEHNDVPVPKVGEGQILVRNQIAGLNFIDTYILPFWSLQSTSIPSYTRP
ncbi:hypothetical protein NXS19_009401 [Fusarium pseudograminearum]|nr:hypothetical protein NXS19_009401 [Fusarium pseudograminearum]